MDGSVYNGLVGFGVCAAVLFRTWDGQDKLIQTRVVGNKVSSFHCEVEGIALGITMIADYFSNTNNRSKIEIAYILSDSHSAIDQCKDVKLLADQKHIDRWLISDRFC